MAATNAAIQTLSVSISLLASGGIAALSLFDVLELKSQPASRSLPSIRWLFSRGSHIFPTAAGLACSGFTYLAYGALPASSRSMLQLLRLGTNSTKVNGYLAAAALAISIAPVTTLLMIPTNFELIKMNEEKGGARSAESARVGSHDFQPGQRSAEDSVDGVGEANQFADLTGPQTETPRKSTVEDDEKTRALLDKFGKMNFSRAVLIGAGGVVGLWTSLM
ncbi:Uu.00g085360.m01.CDS01 [Anthostomella pinea]|uniref:Uu.00g085360.m01.CDS01 n=1 Tax=Anthostomella pinea TaxID=933095 RepID=A0AAI8YJS7_9PEZI|nr:Uu.00g085360.m01.CDS01 [Anthostomella pinea]